MREAYNPADCKFRITRHNTVAERKLATAAQGGLRLRYISHRSLCCVVRFFFWLDSFVQAGPEPRPNSTSVTLAYEPSEQRSDIRKSTDGPGLLCSYYLFFPEPRYFLPLL